MSVVEQPRSSGLIARVLGMLTRPAAEWDKIEGEPATIQGLFVGYAAILAAIFPIMSALVGLLAISVLGYFASLFPFAHATAATVIGRALISYVQFLVTTFVIGLTIDALAPSFDGQRNPVQAMKLAVYSWTAVWVSGLALIIPLLGWLVILAALFYSLYAFWIGAPKLMKTPADKSAAYAGLCMLAALIVAIVIALVFGAARGLLTTAMFGPGIGF